MIPFWLNAIISPSPEFNRKGSLFGPNHILSHFILPVWAWGCFCLRLGGTSSLDWGSLDMPWRSVEDLLGHRVSCPHASTLVLHFTWNCASGPKTSHWNILLTHSSVIAKDQPGWYKSSNQTPRRQVQLMFLTVALFSEPSLVPIL